jgi:hypothetical protein
MTHLRVRPGADTQVRLYVTNVYKPSLTVALVPGSTMR